LRRTSRRAAPERRSPPTVRHAPPPRTSTTHPTIDKSRPRRIHGSVEDTKLSTNKQHSLTQDAVHSVHLYKRPTLPETRTQQATGIDRRTPTTRCHSVWESPGRCTQTAAREPPAVAGNSKKREQRAAPRHGEGGQRRRRTAARRHAAGGGSCPGPAPAAARPAAVTPHDTPPVNNNRMAGRQMSCRQQTGPSTARCSKDVTTHQHRPRARPGRPCPVTACSGQPLPGKRRFQLPIAEQNFSVNMELCSYFVSAKNK